VTRHRRRSRRCRGRTTSLPKSAAMRPGDDHGKRPFGRRVQLQVKAAGRQSRGFWRAFGTASSPRPGLYIYALDDGEADRQLVFTAAKRFCPAVFTSPRAATTPEAVLAPGCAARSLTDVLSVESAELSELVWAWYWLCAPFTNVVRAVLTSLRSAVIAFTMPVPTLTCLSLSSEARKAAASAHRTEFDGEVAGEAVVADEVAVEEVLPEEVPLPDPHPTASSARPHTTMTSFHRAALVTVLGFIYPARCRAASDPRLTLRGLLPAPGRLAAGPDANEAPLSKSVGPCSPRVVAVCDLRLTARPQAGTSLRAVSLGAAVLTDQVAEPGGVFIVHADPAGHPFCLFMERPLT
jgi:hypothetical protein